MDGDDSRLFDAVSAAARTMARALESQLSEAALTLDQWRALRVLAAADGLTMGALSEQLQTSPATTTRLVDSLVDRALVYRAAGRADRRQVLVAVSDAGRAGLDVAEGIVAAHEAQLRRRLGDAPLDDVLVLLGALTDLPTDHAVVPRT